MDGLRIVLNPDFLVILICGGWSPGPTPQRDGDGACRWSGVGGGADAAMSEESGR
jgi:hypothetical protein